MPVLAVGLVQPVVRSVPRFVLHVLGAGAPLQVSWGVVELLPV